MILVDATPKTIRVEAPARLADIVSSIPGLRAVKGEAAWEGPTTAAAIISISRNLAHLQGFMPSTRATALMSRIKDLKTTVKLAKKGLCPDYDDRLWETQPAGVWMLVERKRAVIGDDMGTGKTVMGLTAARQVKPGKTLVVAPNSMKYRWAREVETWFPEAAPFVLDGTAANKQKVMEEVLHATEEGYPVVVSVNWESLAPLSRIAGYGSIKLTEKDVAFGPLNNVEWDCVIADEVHRAKDPKAKQTRALWYLAKPAEYRWGLTGTPVLNSPADLWAIGRFYDPDTYGTSSHKWHHYFVEYEDTYWGPVDKGLRRDHADEFAAWFDLGFIRRTKEEAGLGLPEITYQTRELALTPKQKAAYNKMVKDMMVVIDDDYLIATNPLTLLTRLSQIASATPVVDDMNVIALDNPSNKINALVGTPKNPGIIDELGEGKSLVVFAQSEKLITLACSELDRRGFDYIRITGQENARTRDVNIELFQGGEVPIAMVTLAAGNEGIDLFAADTAVFLQRSYAYGMNTQAESRIHRAGQTSDKVTVIDLVSKGTVDEDVIKALQSKGEMAEQVLRDQARHLLRERV